jgi:hypothetical protein
MAGSGVLAGPKPARGGTVGIAGAPEQIPGIERLRTAALSHDLQDTL